jgi:hypothetical protein
LDEARERHLARESGPEQASREMSKFGLTRNKRLAKLYNALTALNGVKYALTGTWALPPQKDEATKRRVATWAWRCKQAGDISTLDFNRIAVTQ